MPMELYITLPEPQIITIALCNILANSGFSFTLSRKIRGEGIFIIDESQIPHLKRQSGQLFILATREIRCQQVFTIIKTELSGCIEFCDTANHLLTTVRHVNSGKSYFAPKVLKMLLQKEIVEQGERMYSLTGREIEVVELTRQGMPNADIGLKLGIGIRTVNAHKRKILSKTQLQSMEELMARAHDYGIIS